MAANSSKLQMAYDLPQKRRGGKGIIVWLLMLMIMVGGAFGGWWLRRNWREIVPASNAVVPTTETIPEAMDPSQRLPGAEAAPPEAEVPASLQAPEPDPEPAETMAAAPTTTATEEPPDATAPPRESEPAAETTETVAEQPAPDLSEPRGVLLAVDRRLDKGEYAKAESTLQPLLASSQTPPIRAAAQYRMGLIKRQTKREAEAQKHWRTGYEQYSETVSGRYCALALADTWFRQYAVDTKEKKHWEGIRDAYSTAFGMDGTKTKTGKRFLDKATRLRIARNVNALNEYLVFSRAPYSRAVFHTVRPGEVVSVIARQYDLHNWTAIEKTNRINPHRIKVGMKLKIVTGRCFILVDKKDLTLTWYLDGVMIRQYACAVGPEGKTPTGRFIVTDMAVNPDWTNPDDGRIYRYGDSKNIIGTRWIAIKGLDGQPASGLGVHGTTRPESIPGRGSNGCVRLLNKHVEELYGFVSIRRGRETEIMVIE